MRGNLLFVGLLMVVAATTNAEELPVVFQEDFEKGADRWEPTDAAAWKIEAVGDNSVYSQFKKQSKYKPPHRSPYNIALIRGVNVGDFVLTARVRSTHPDYGHRDVCLFFGYQDAAHFHYVHLGKKADAHANQIFIVNKAPRTKISITTTKGTNWDDQWHRVKIIRTVQDGRIEVYFDDMKKPVMTAKDITFQWGRVGLGSFDDTGHWDDIVLRGKLVKKP
ncbi:MAG: hypothetical protein VB853_00335 [Pirellulales bacterium]